MEEVLDKTVLVGVMATLLLLALTFNLLLLVLLVCPLNRHYVIRPFHLLLLVCPCHRHPVARRSSPKHVLLVLTCVSQVLTACLHHALTLRLFQSRDGHLPPPVSSCSVVVLVELSAYIFPTLTRLLVGVVLLTEAVERWGGDDVRRVTWGMAVGVGVYVSGVVVPVFFFLYLHAATEPCYPGTGAVLRYTRVASEGRALSVVSYILPVLLIVAALVAVLLAHRGHQRRSKEASAPTTSSASRLSSSLAGVQRKEKGEWPGSSVGREREDYSGGKYTVSDESSSGKGPSLPWDAVLAAVLVIVMEFVFCVRQWAYWDQVDDRLMSTAEWIQLWAADRVLSLLALVLVPCCWLLDPYVREALRCWGKASATRRAAPLPHTWLTPSQGPALAEDSKGGGAFKHSDSKGKRAGHSDLVEEWVRTGRSMSGTGRHDPGHSGQSAIRTHDTPRPLQDWTRDGERKAEERDTRDLWNERQDWERKDWDRDEWDKRGQWDNRGQWDKREERSRRQGRARTETLSPSQADRWQQPRSPRRDDDTANDEQESNTPSPSRDWSGATDRPGVHTSPWAHGALPDQRATQGQHRVMSQGAGPLHTSLAPPAAVGRHRGAESPRDGDYPGRGRTTSRGDGTETSREQGKPTQELTRFASEGRMQHENWPQSGQRDWSPMSGEHHHRSPPGDHTGRHHYRPGRLGGAGERGAASHGADQYRDSTTDQSSPGQSSQAAHSRRESDNGHTDQTSTDRRISTSPQWQRQEQHPGGRPAWRPGTTADARGRGLVVTVPRGGADNPSRPRHHDNHDGQDARTIAQAAAAVARQIARPHPHGPLALRRPGDTPPTTTNTGLQGRGGEQRYTEDTPQARPHTTQHVRGWVDMDVADDTHHTRPHTTQHTRGWEDQAVTEARPHTSGGQRHGQQHRAGRGENRGPGRDERDMPGTHGQRHRPWGRRADHGGTDDSGMRGVHTNLPHHHRQDGSRGETGQGRGVTERRGPLGHNRFAGHEPGARRLQFNEHGSQGQPVGQLVGYHPETEC